MIEPRVTIGVVPRERFSEAPEALRALLRNTHQPFELIVVDPGMPDPWRQEVVDVVAQHEDATLLSVPPDERPFLPNRARNLVIDHAHGDWICLLENDTLVGEDWLPPLLDAAEANGAGAAVPLILERFGPFEKVHFDDRLHHIVDTPTSTGVERRIEPRADSKERDRGGSVRIVDFIETHCMLFRRDALDRVDGFDGEITAQEEIDISLALHAQGLTAVLAPSSVVTFMPPPPVHPGERDYYLAKWNPETYERDHRRMAERWGIVGYPSAVGVVEARRAMVEGDVEAQIGRELEQRERLDATRRDLAPLLGRGPLILVHDNQLDLSLVCPEADVRPFLERDGLWWGQPDSSATAITELDRMRAEGAATLAFAAGSAWWLEYYGEFADHLRSSFRVLSETPEVTAFDLTATENDAERP